ncbi:MAG: HAD family hydrolase [Acidobacteria bacterium]|nr:HAD family hydrolase [Acidobacteriota bacterium]MBV9478386.1 HAD family hydrolase [Acidobacteriota bacterium]
MIRAVAFDLWETLITDTPDLSRSQERLRTSRMEAILTARGYGALADRIEHAYRALWRRCHELYWSADLDVPCRRQIEHFLEELEVDVREFDEAMLAELEHAYAHAAVDVPPAVVAGAAETLRALKSRGLGVGLISNTGRTPGYALRRILDVLGLASSIDVMVFSNEHGACKPQPSIFEELRRGLGVAYDELVFVGDNAYVDVHGAQRCGMRAVLFEPPVRGTAVAPPVEHGLTIVPDATVHALPELVEVIDSLGARG